MLLLALGLFSAAPANAGLWDWLGSPCYQALVRPLTQKAPKWPSRRNMQRYEELTNLPIVSLLKDRDVWIDIGPGEGVALAQLAELKPEVQLVGVSAHDQKFDPRIKVIYGKVPSDKTTLNIYGQGSQLVTDIYAAVSYNDDPLAALIYERLLLKSGGLLGAVTELERFGDRKNWESIRNWFADVLNADLDFEEIKTFADANKVWESTLRITVKASATNLTYSAAMAQAKEYFGDLRVGRVLWQTPDGSSQIRVAEYSKLAK